MRYSLIVAIFLAAASTNAIASDLLACIDPDVVEALVARGARSDYEITDSLPEELSDLELPDEFRLIGTQRSLRYLKIAFSADEKPDQALLLIEEPLNKLGWTKIELPQTRSHSRGFQSAQMESHSQVVLCNVDKESLSISSRGNDRGTYVFIGKSASSSGNLCISTNSMDPYAESEYTNALMPDLYLPEDAEQLGSGFGGMIRSSGDDAETHIRLVTKKRADEILSYISAQLSEQGWASDSSWAGQYVSGSSWILDKKDIPKTMGTLVILEHGPGDYTAQFSMIAL